MSTPTFSPEIEEQLELIIDLVNDGYADSLALVCRWVEADDAIESARILTIDPEGADAEVDTGDGPRPVRFDFDSPIGDLGALEHEMLGLVEKARNARPGDPLTVLEARLETVAQQLTHHCAVVEVEDLGPRLRRFVFGPVPNWTDYGGDQSMTIFLPLPGRPVPDEITFAELREMDDAVRPKGATYSIRSHDPDAQTIDVWMARHGDDPETLSGWAGQAEIGDPVVLFGPRGGSSIPADVTHVVGVADETGIAATLAMIDLLPAATTADIIVETGVAGTEYLTIDRPGTTVHWAYRDDAEPGTGTQLLDTTRRVLAEARDDVAVVGAAESRCITAVRKYVRRELEIPASNVSLTGYWRKG
ncbi:MAG: SIP domain-containing protein [Actinomycetota bacterium]